MWEETKTEIYPLQFTIRFICTFCKGVGHYYYSYQYPTHNGLLGSDYGVKCGNCNGTGYTEIIQLGNSDITDHTKYIYNK